LVICVLNVATGDNTINNGSNSNGNKGRNARARVYTMLGTATDYRNLVMGFLSYAHNYLYAVDHSISISYEGDDVVITVKIINVASKIPRFESES